MRNEFTAIFERDGEWFIALLSRDSLREWSGPHKGSSARELGWRNCSNSPGYPREDCLRGVPTEAEREISYYGEAQHIALAFATTRLLSQARKEILTHFGPIPPPAPI